MCKPPRIGVSKTRLAADIGPQVTAALAAAFLRDVVTTILRAADLEDVACYAFYKPEGAEAEVRDFVPQSIPVLLQEGDELGAVMFAAIKHMLSECPAGALVIGSDVPTFQLEHLCNAVRKLRSPGPCAVLAPAADGGYCLLGGNDLSIGKLLEPLPWSTPQVLSMTRQRALDAQLPLYELPLCVDVDDREGLKLIIDELTENPDLAPHTRAVLIKAGLFEQPIIPGV